MRASIVRELTPSCSGIQDIPSEMLQRVNHQIRQDLLQYLAALHNFTYLRCIVHTLRFSFCKINKSLYEDVFSILWGGLWMLLHWKKHVGFKAIFSQISLVNFRNNYKHMASNTESNMRFCNKNSFYVKCIPIIFVQLIIFFFFYSVGFVTVLTDSDKHFYPLNKT